ncbi:DUF302 domain-containing protein [[Mycobacterium] holstebronense]|uniref:DUF302 domain-containing protein n=1 Tax=[Mycobacterium] holstebronense TaxID=3064288 RepID=A0ABN9MXP9_9MYCO|nr:DUF302 domain-containing protein [Mycolicibacter sp. MU0102]CAJ1496959.1 DUF302 domain-containing protein [Mycolicibacter sp. MU0102]
MSQCDPQERHFSGVQVRYQSTKSYEELVAALLADVGKQPVPIDDVAKDCSSWESYRDEVESHVGASGFMLFATFDHGGWITKAGIDRKVLRVIIGNPLIAITMLRHDVTAGLFAPVELLLVGEESGGSSLIYVKPSSLMVVEPNPALLAAAEELDVKLAVLASKVAG